MTETTKQPKKLEGTVTSDRMQKTCVVAVSRLKKHAKYLTYYKVTSKFKVHDETNDAHVGDRVVIQETRPLSKDKRWRLLQIVERARATETAPVTEP